MSKQRIVVGLAWVGQGYGGPEEGGWYYSVGTPLDSHQKVFFREESAEVYYNHLREIYGQGFRGIGVGGCGDDEGLARGNVDGMKLTPTRQYFHKKSKSSLQAWPERMPHYE